MSKKIFDILPPGKEIQEKKVVVQKTKNVFNIRRWILVGGLFLFLLAVIYQVLGTSFVLYLEPVTRIINSETELRVLAERNESNFQENILAGEEIIRQVSESRRFKASGQKNEERRAQGVVRVHNLVSPPREINLRAATRFLASGGEYFRASQAISLPPARLEGGRLAASVTEVLVEAIDPGENYNIGPTKFSVPGLLGTEIYDKIYGESLEAMSGGARLVLPQVTQADLRQAEDVLRIELVNQIIAELEKDNLDRVVLPDAVSVEIVDSGYSAKVGETVDEFEGNLTIKGRAVGFSREELNEFLKAVIKREAGEEYGIVPGSLHLDYRMLSHNPATKSLRTNVKFSAEIYQELDLDQWSQVLIGLNRSELKEKIMGDARIRAFQFRLTPFWLKRVPRSDKIEVQFRFR